MYLYNKLVPNSFASVLFKGYNKLVPNSFASVGSRLAQVGVASGLSLKANPYTLNPKPPQPP